jgi:transposase
MYHIGLDVHLRTSTVHILDENGRDIETRTLRGSWHHMVDWLRHRVKEPFAICYEASLGYGPLYDTLTRIATRVVVAHPGNLRLIFRSKRKNDRVDAKKLAKLLYLDDVPAVHVPGIEVRAWRQLIEFRRREIDKRTRVKNSIRALLRHRGMVPPAEIRDLWSKRGIQWLRELNWADEDAQFQMNLLLLQLDQAIQVVSQVTDRLDKIAIKHPGVGLLTTIPGVGLRTAEAVLAYLDDFRRFGRINRVGAYFGLVPSQDASAAVNRLGHITKQGPATVRRFLVEAAWQLIRRCPHTRAYFDRVKGESRNRNKIALVATAHKLIRCMLAMLRTGQTWCPNAIT